MENVLYVKDHLSVSKVDVTFSIYIGIGSIRSIVKI